MTPPLSAAQRVQVTKTMSALASLCPNHYGPYYCSPDCTYKSRHLCPAELSLHLQHFMESTESDRVDTNPNMVKRPVIGIVTLTREYGVIITDKQGVSSLLCEHRDLFDKISLAARYIIKVFGKQAQMELRSWEYGSEYGAYSVVLIVRLPKYGDGVLAKLDRITNDIGLDDGYGLLLLTTDFKIIGNQS